MAHSWHNLPTLAFIAFAAFLNSAAAFVTPTQGFCLGTGLQAKADMSSEEYEEKMEKATKAMTAFTNKYLKNTDTKLCSDKSVPAVVIKGLAEHKVDLGAPLCPCRFYEDKEAEAKDGYWNCPCVVRLRTVSALFGSKMSFTVYRYRRSLTSFCFRLHNSANERKTRVSLHAIFN